MASAAWSPLRQPSRTPMVSFIRSTPRVATALDFSVTRVVVPVTGAELLSCRIARVIWRYRFRPARVPRT